MRLTVLVLLATIAGCDGAVMTPALDGASDGAAMLGDSAHGDAAAALDADVGPLMDTGVALDAFVVGSDTGPQDDTGADAFATADAALTADAFALDAATITDAWSPRDAWTMPTGACGNGTIDPGEVCDPGVRMMAPDGGTYVAPVNAAYCPSCTAVVCIGAGPITGTGTPADNRCVYYSAAAPVTTMYPGWVARVLSWGSVAERDAYIAAFRTLGGTTTGHIAAQRTTVATTSCSGCGSACSTTPASICATSGATGRCVAWYWLSGSGPYASMPVVGMPRSTGACPSLAATHVYLTITAADVTSSQDTFATPGFLVVLDPPGSAS
jgi:hypothetical protein